MSSSKLALQATWHCLLGCSIGEILGMMLGAHFMWSNTPTVVVSILLAFITGFGLSALPLVRSGMPLARSLRLVFAADSLSITTMEVVDNLIMVLIPGAMVATLVDGLFWGSMTVSLTAAFVVAYPVNRYLLERGKGHALTHEHMHGSHESHAMQEHEHHA